jgi:hypothetical protein
MGLEQLQNIRDHRNDPKIKKVYRIQKVSAKKSKQLLEQKATAEKDKEFYLEVWRAAPHKCYNCGCGLPKTPSNFMFHHLLEKRNYPELRYEPLNIAILCLECHSKCETNIDFAPAIKEMRHQVKLKLVP